MRSSEGFTATSLGNDIDARCMHLHAPAQVSCCLVGRCTRWCCLATRSWAPSRQWVVWRSRQGGSRWSRGTISRRTSDWCSKRRCWEMEGWRTGAGAETAAVVRRGVAGSGSWLCACVNRATARSQRWWFCRWCAPSAAHGDCGCCGSSADRWACVHLCLLRSAVAVPS